MVAPRINRIASYAGQALGYTAFCAALAYFATRPPYQPLPPDAALVKVSLQHAGQRKEACRERTPEELAKIMHRENVKWTKVIRDANVKVE